MKLTAKLVLVFLLGILLIQGVNAYWMTRREDERFQEQMHQHAQHLSELMRRHLASTSNPNAETADQLARVIDDEQPLRRIRVVYYRNWPSDRFRPSAPVELFESVTYTEVFHFVTRESQQSERLLHVYSPIGEVDGKPVGIELTSSFAGAERYNRTTLYQTLAVVAATLLCGFGVTLLGVRMVGHRLEMLIDKTRRIARGDFSSPVHLKGKDELSQLGASLNDMCSALSKSQQTIQAESTARVAAVQQLRHADRLNTVGRLASGIAHEMGTPLNVVSGRAGLIASGKLSDEEVRVSAETIRNETDRITVIIRQLLDFARRGSPQRTVADLRDIAGQTADLLGPMAEKHRTALSLKTGEQPLRAQVDVAQIQQVLTNLVVNAIQAMPDGGVVEIKLATADGVSPDDPPDTSRPCFCLSVRDQGAGVSEEDLAHLFEPFFTTKDVGEGTGLGLSVSYGIVRDHDGWIDVSSAPGQGSCFTVYLPREANQCSDES